MNRTFKRLVIPVGMAAAVSTAGFAFMASNTVALGSAGQGENGVSGYSVSNISYSTEQGWGKALPTFSVSTAKFILTSNSTQDPANKAPSTVTAALLGTAAQSSSCTVGTWTVNGAGNGSGAVVCNFASPPNVADVTGLNVEANQ